MRDPGRFPRPKGSCCKWEVSPASSAAPGRAWPGDTCCRRVHDPHLGPSPSYACVGLLSPRETGKEVGCVLPGPPQPLGPVPHRYGSAAPSPSRISSPKTRTFPLSSLRLRHIIPLNISCKACLCGTETSVCVPASASPHERPRASPVHSRDLLLTWSSPVPALCSRFPPPVLTHTPVLSSARGRSVRPWGGDRRVSLSTGSCQVTRVAVNPDTLSCLLAGAQRCREMAEVSNEDPAPSSGMVRPLSPTPGVPWPQCRGRSRYGCCRVGREG